MKMDVSDVLDLEWSTKQLVSGARGKRRCFELCLFGPRTVPIIINKVYCW